VGRGCAAVCVGTGGATVAVTGGAVAVSMTDAVTGAASSGSAVSVVALVTVTEASATCGGGAEVVAAGAVLGAGTVAVWRYPRSGPRSLPRGHSSTAPMISAMMATKPTAYAGLSPLTITGGGAGGSATSGMVTGACGGAAIGSGVRMVACAACGCDGAAVRTVSRCSVSICPEGTRSVASPSSGTAMVGISFGSGSDRSIASSAVANSRAEEKR